MTRFCANCGTEVDENAAFCPTCGQPIDDTREVDLPPAPAWPEPPAQPPAATPTPEPQPTWQEPAPPPAPEPQPTW